MADSQRAIRFEHDARAERATLRLRLSAAVMVTLAGLWLFALPNLLPRAFALAGFVFAALWIARALRERGQQRDPAEHYLELAEDALRMREGEKVQEVLWADIQTIYVDEDRLVVRVTRRGGPALEIEPLYRGLGLDELFQAVKKAHAAAAGAGNG